ncbi:sulfur carrier protein ThiS [Aceticella autotrophica]|uniref:Sulfur carrier protein ThiS n=1 Tax=Aceticella autotrophica TaxID=2755338 RepID=A0A975AUU5_9THEO|nr:sulfur carrier protein ThiS [Aceticella autotrophica]QSZ26869.1 sulfur carrier protein ThiS [Aceticella autotrophica]
MRLKLNGEEVLINKKMTLLEFLSSKGINPDTVVVEYNYDIVKKEKWSQIILKENDNLEVVRFVGGG